MIGPALRKTPSSVIKFKGKAGGRARFNTEWFFDRKAVENRIGKKTATAMRRCAALTRSIARNSMKFTSYKSRKYSPPGSPPFYHVRSAKGGGAKSASGYGLRMIQYYFDTNHSTAIIGPLGRSGSGYSVPETLEKGGMMRPQTRYRNNRRSTGVMYRVAKRPYMAPALDKTRTQYPKQWRNALR